MEDKKPVYILNKEEYNILLKQKEEKNELAICLIKFINSVANYDLNIARLLEEKMTKNGYSIVYDGSFETAIFGHGTKIIKFLKSQDK